MNDFTFITFALKSSQIPSPYLNIMYFIFMATIHTMMRIFTHFSDCIQEEQNQNSKQDHEINSSLVIKGLQKPGFEKRIPSFWACNGQNQQQHNSNFQIEKPGNYCPLQTHFDDFKKVKATFEIESEILCTNYIQATQQKYLSNLMSPG